MRKEHKGNNGGKYWSDLNEAKYQIIMPASIQAKTIQGMNLENIKRFHIEIMSKSPNLLSLI